VRRVEINYSGKVNKLETGPITPRGPMKGFLQSAGGADINEVNAPGVLPKVSIKVTETRLSAAGDYTDLGSCPPRRKEKPFSVGGAFFGATRE